MTYPTNNFGLYLRARRQHCGLSLRDLEKLSGVDHVCIHQYEHDVHSPTVEVAEQLAAGLGMTFTWKFTKRRVSR